MKLKFQQWGLGLRLRPQHKPHPPKHALYANTKTIKTLRH